MRAGGRWGGEAAADIYGRYPEGLDALPHDTQVHLIATLFDTIRKGGAVDVGADRSWVGAWTEGSQEGARAGWLNVLDTFTFGQIESLSTANARAWEEIGLEGTWTQTISSGAALVARETLIAAATMGTGSAIQTVRGTAGVGRAVQQMNNAGRIGRFFNTTRSALAQGMASRVGGISVGGVQAGLRGLQAVNWAGRGYGAYQSAQSSLDGYRMVRDGNPMGWLMIAGAAIPASAAFAGGFGATRRLLGFGRNPIKLFHHTRTVEQLDRIARMGIVLAKTEGRVYASAWGRLSRFRAYRLGLRRPPSGGRVEFVGQATSLFKRHPLQGWFSALKRLSGQYVTRKVGYDISFSSSQAYKHGTILRISEADLVRQSAGRYVWSHASFFGRFLLVDWGIPFGAAGVYFYRNQIAGYLVESRLGEVADDSPDDD